ncbi:hypothetical protein [Anaerotignum propionicum]|nr:hypothetical protein [Anaerotignum propionicum]
MFLDNRIYGILSTKLTKAYQDFINVLSQIIGKHGAEVLDEINRVV